MGLGLIGPCEKLLQLYQMNIAHLMKLYISLMVVPFFLSQL
jgi:hypothetical protein